MLNREDREKAVKAKLPSFVPQDHKINIARITIDIFELIEKYPENIYDTRDVAFAISILENFFTEIVEDNIRKIVDCLPNADSKTMH